MLVHQHMLPNILIWYVKLVPPFNEQHKDVVNENKHLFPNIPTRTNKIFHDDVGDAIPVKQYPYWRNSFKKEYLQKEIKYLLENDFIEPSNSSWSSPCVLVPKPDKTFWMCTDYRKLNAVTKTDSYPMPRIDDCIDKIGHSKYNTKFDLLKGFLADSTNRQSKRMFCICDSKWIISI